MADDKTKQDGRDRSKVNSSEEYEVQHLREKFPNRSVEEIRRAIEEAGPSREKIEERLGR